MNEEELREKLTDSSPAVREYNQEAFGFRRFYSVSPFAIFILGGAFALFTGKAVVEWQSYATLDMGFIAWVVLAASCVLCAVGRYVGLSSEAARWALRIVRLFDAAFADAKLKRFSRSWID